MRSSGARGIEADAPSAVGFPLSLEDDRILCWVQFSTVLLGCVSWLCLASEMALSQQRSLEGNLEHSSQVLPYAEVSTL